MAARAAILSLTRTRLTTPSLRAPMLSLSFIRSPVPNLFYRSVHNTPLLSADTAPNPNDSLAKTPAPPVTPNADSGEETSNSSYLGEADRDDGFDSYKEAYGKPEESLDAGNSAYLGEADSDDGFESRKDIDGEKLEAVDASQSAYLGEADSDDGFESDKHLNPEKYDHKIEDASASGEHGQPGEGDQ